MNSDEHTGSVSVPSNVSGIHRYGPGITKLTPDQVNAIRNDARPHGVVAKVYNISPSTVRDIRSWKTWKRGQTAAKLDAEKVKAIRADTRIARVIAADYGISRTMVGQVKRRQSWKDV